MKFSFEISIEGQTQQEAAVKLQAAATLIQKLKVREIAKLADVVKNDAVKTDLAKRALGL